MGDIEYLVSVYIHRYEKVNTQYIMNDVQYAGAVGTTHSNDTYDHTI